MLLITCAWVLTGCGGQGEASALSGAGEPFQVAAPPAEIAAGFLVAPSRLGLEPQPNRSGSYDPADLVLDGAQYEASLPFQRITEEILEELTFDAVWSEENPSLDDLAFCIYRFTAVDFDRAPQIRCIWDLYFPEDPANLWIAAANWDNDCWDWYQGNDDSTVFLPSIEPYSDTGDILVAVVICGTESCKLTSLILGPHTTAVLTGGPASGISPVTVNCNAGSSSCLTGSIYKYEWDWDNDGTFDEDTLAVSTASHTYSSVGVHTATVRVTDSLLIQQDTDSITVEVRSPWAHSWGNAEFQGLDGLAYDGADAIYQTGYTYFEGDNNLLLVKSDLDGNVIWAKRWGGANSDSGYDVTVTSNGGVYVTGVTRSFGAGNADILLQRWDSAGNLQWTCTWGSGDDDTALAIGTYQNALYVAGTTDGFSDSDGDALLIKFDDAGNELWARTVGGADADSGQDLDIIFDALSDSMYCHLIGTTESYASSGSGILYARFTRDGAVSTAGVLDGPNDETGFGLEATGLFGGTLYLCGSSGDSEAPALIAAVDAGILSMAKQLGADEHIGILDLAYRSNVGIVCCGYKQAPAYYMDGLLLNLSTGGALQGAQTWNVEEDSCELHAIELYPGSGFLVAGYGLKADSGAWSPAAVTVEDTSVTWQGISVSPQSISGTPGEVMTTEPVDITAEGVMDSGGGFNDALLFACQAP